MADRRKRNIEWYVADEKGKSYGQRDGPTLAVLMDLRDELKALNATLSVISGRLDCRETLSIPRILRRISANTHKPKRRRKPLEPI